MSRTSSNLSRRGFLQTTGAAALAVSPVTDGQTFAAETKPNGPQSDKKIRMGIVGGGFGASFQWHLDPNCIVEAVSDLRSDRRAKLQKVYKCEKSYDSLEKLILDPKIDAVAVFSGAPDHARHMIDCMEHGNSHTFLTHEFISALVEDREPAVDIYEALAMTTPGIVANESAKRDGEQLKIPCFDKA